MTRAAYLTVLSLLAILLMWRCSDAIAAAPGDPALIEVRICGTSSTLRDADGSIHRRSDVLRAFRSLVPCPATGHLRGACPGWAIDHIWPLASGGCDSVPNLQWLPAEGKSCAAWWCKDRWERTVYPALALPPGVAQ